MKRRSRLVIILLLVLTAAVISFALIFMGSVGETPAVSLPSPGANEAMESGAPEAQRVELTPDNVQAVLAELERAEVYSCTVTVEDYWTGGSSRNELQVWVSSGRVRIRGAIGGGTRNVLLADGTLYIWYDSVSGVYSGPGGADADAWMRSVTYEDVLSLPRENSTGAEYVQYSGADCIRCGYIDAESGYDCVVYVSVSTGLLMGADCYDNDTLIYRMYSSAPELSSPDENMFSPPDGAEA